MRKIDGKETTRERQAVEYMELRNPNDVGDVPERARSAGSGVQGTSYAAVQALTPAAPDLVFRFGRDGTCLGFKVAEGLNLSVHASNYVGKKLHEVLRSTTGPTATNLLDRTLQTGTPHTFECRLAVHGDARMYEARLIPSCDDEVVALVYDAAKQMQLHEQVLISQKMEAVGHLAGGVAHDFNNLLTAIMGYCQLGMHAGVQEESATTALLEIQKAAERGAGLCRQLLVFSGGPAVQPRAVALNDLLLDMGGMLQRLIGEDTELVIRPANDPCLVEVDPVQFEQVLVNLAVNARDAMPNGGRLSLETSTVSVDEGSDARFAGAGIPPGEYVTLAVNDTGAGMSPEVRPHIFEPFFTTKGPGRGAGIGLFTSYSIVSQSNGYITVRSEESKGTTFEIYLPRAEGFDALPVPQEKTVSLPRGRETVLLVEDEQTVREVAVRVLRERGYTVLEASGAVEALGLVQRHIGQGVDLLLTDVVMPLMSGPELAGRLRLAQPGIRVLFTSGYTESDIGEFGLQKWATGFLQKPFTPADLAQKVRAVLEN